MNIKKIFPVAFLAIMSLAGCRGGENSNLSNDESIPMDSSGNIEFNNIKLTFGNPITGADGAHMRRLVKNFNEEYKGKIEISESYVTEKSFYENLELTIPMNRAPEVVLVHSYKVAAYANRDLLLPLNDALETSGVEISREDYLANVYDACVFESKQYAIPLDIHTTLLYYNKDLLQKYNLSVPTNRQELLNACSKMPNTTAGGWGLPLSIEWPSEYIYATAFYQNGGVDFDAEGNPGFKSEAGEKALKSISDIIHKYKYSLENCNVDGDLGLFCQGKAMFHIQGDWMLKQIENEGVNFGVTSLANMFVDEPTATSEDVYARSHVFAIPKNSRLSATKQQACLTFIKYITEHADIWAESGHIPANNKARETQEYANLPHHGNFGNLSKYRLNDPNPYYYEGFSPVFSRVTTALSNADYNAQELLNSAYEEGIDAIAMAKDV